MKKQHIGGNCLRGRGWGGGGLDSLQFYGGARRKRGGGVFKGG